jgi:prepilin-type N-terminal cleavage/methylation domain-containing protein
MQRRGFTIVELIIVITIMGILLVLGVVNLRGSQVTARDTQRRGDVDAIAANLEQYYNTGNTNLGLNAGTYLSTTSWDGTNAGLLSILTDMDPKSIVAPGNNDLTHVSFIPATCSGSCVQTTSGVTPQSTIDQFVYQPLQSDGTLCTNVTRGCRKFNIFFRLEIATIDCPGPSNICMVSSKNQ